MLKRKFVLVSRNEATMSQLAMLRDQAEQIGLLFALPPLEAALAS